MNAYICVDASVAAKWVLPEEYRDQALGFYEDSRSRSATIAVPPHFPVEVTNVIRRRVARHFLTHAEGLELLRIFVQFSVRLVIPQELYEEAFNLAERFNLPTVYDTHYLALAKLLGCDLWTADQGLLNALGEKLPYVKWVGRYPG